MTKKKDIHNLNEVRQCVIGKPKLEYVENSQEKEYQKVHRQKGNQVLPIMSYSTGKIYLVTSCEDLPNIDLKKFNYQTGTFKKAWGPNHKKLTLTPSKSDIREVEIEIQGINPKKDMKLLKDKKGDIIESDAHVKITRHYKLKRYNKK
ncbi:MAG: hypothetical protein ACOCUU_00930 [Nanoarchaeota archaeon]